MPQLRCRLNNCQLRGQRALPTGKATMARRGRKTEAAPAPTPAAPRQTRETAKQADAPVETQQRPKSRKVIWQQRIIGAEAPDAVTTKALAFDIVDTVADPDDVDGILGNQDDEAESFQKDDAVNSAVEAQAAADGNLDDVMWMSDAKEDALLASLRAVGEDLISKSNRAKAEADTLRKLAADREATLYGVEEGGEEDAILKDLVIEELLNSPSKRQQMRRGTDAADQTAAVAEEGTPSASSKQPQHQAARVDAVPLPNPFDAVEDNLTEESRSLIRGGLSVNANLKLFDIFPTMEDADIAVRASGAQTSPFMRMVGGRPTKRVYLCNHKTMSGFRGCRKLQSQSSSKGTKRGGNRSNSDAMQALLDKVPEGKCSAFVEIAEVKAASLLTGSWRK